MIVQSHDKSLGSIPDITGPICLLKGFSYGIDYSNANTKECCKTLINEVVTQNNVICWDGDSFSGSSFTKLLMDIVDVRSKLKTKQPKLTLVGYKMEKDLEQFAKSWEKRIPEQYNETVQLVNIATPNFDNFVELGTFVAKHSMATVAYCLGGGECVLNEFKSEERIVFHYYIIERKHKTGKLDVLSKDKLMNHANVVIHDLQQAVEKSTTKKRKSKTKPAKAQDSKDGEDNAKDIKAKGSRNSEDKTKSKNAKGSRNSEDKTKSKNTKGSTNDEDKTNSKKSNDSVNVEGYCLTLHQPWASLVVYGIKRAEGRSWPWPKDIPKRQQLWIHAASRIPDPGEIAAVEEQYREVFKGQQVDFPQFYPTSCLLGCIDMIDCVSATQLRETYETNTDPLIQSVVSESGSNYIFLCQNARRLVLPIQMSGEHKLWKIPLGQLKSYSLQLKDVESPKEIQFSKDF